MKTHLGKLINRLATNWKSNAVDTRTQKNTHTKLKVEEKRKREEVVGELHTRIQAKHQGTKLAARSSGHQNRCSSGQIIKDIFWDNVFNKGKQTDNTRRQ